jgi:hypothetical protein
MLVVFLLGCLRCHLYFYITFVSFRLRCDFEDRHLQFSNQSEITPCGHKYLIRFLNFLLYMNNMKIIYTEYHDITMGNIRLINPLRENYAETQRQLMCKTYRARRNYNFSIGTKLIEMCNVSFTIKTPTKAVRQSITFQCAVQFAAVVCLFRYSKAAPTGSTSSQ